MTPAMLYRRIIMTFIAMYLRNYPWIQVDLFMLCSLGMAILLCYTWPYTTTFRNRLEVINELTVLIVANFATANIALSNPLERQSLGLILHWIIITDIFFNVGIILGI